MLAHLKSLFFTPSHMRFWFTPGRRFSLGRHSRCLSCSGRAGAKVHEVRRAPQPGKGWSTWKVFLLLERIDQAFNLENTWSPGCSGSSAPLSPPERLLQKMDDSQYGKPFETFVINDWGPMEIAPPLEGVVGSHGGVFSYEALKWSLDY